MAKEKFYVVWTGRKPGVYANWTECQEQVNKYDGAKFKSFDSKSAADDAFKAGWEKHWGQGKQQKGGHQAQPTFFEIKDEIDYNSISVDVGTNGNPGPVEFKGVDTQTGEVIFSVGPINKGTNNLGEFLAIVHALAYLKKQGSTKTVYSDSKTALKWIKEKQVVTTLVRDETTKQIWNLVDRALMWLKENTYDNKVVKWQTQHWGEIKADYGRKK